MHPGHACFPGAWSPCGFTPPQLCSAKWTKAYPLPGGEEQGDSLKLGFLSSGPQPACNGWKPGDAIGQRVPGEGYRPCSTKPLHKAAEPAVPPYLRRWKARGAAGSLLPEQLWHLHRFPGNINNYPAIWNRPWAGQQKVSPRLCPISAGYLGQMQKISRR